MTVHPPDRDSPEPPPYVPQDVPTSNAAPAAGAGWYPDDSGTTRWWDGSQWGATPLDASPRPNTAVLTPEGLGPPDQRSNAALAHWLGAGLLLFCGGWLGWAGPLLILLTATPEQTFVRKQATEALNFQLTMAMILIPLQVVAFILLFVLIGYFFIPIIILIQLAGAILGTIAGAEVNRGEDYQYPLCIRLVN